MTTGSDDATDRPLLLLVASGMRPYREYLLKSIATRFEVHLFHTVEPSWEQEYLSGWTVLPDTWDGPAMAKAALDLHAATPIAGVLCWDEVRIHATAYIAEALGLPNGDPAVLWRMRDKAQTRAALAAAGVPQPASVPVGTEQEALAAAERLGYPVVLKPRGFGASLGVIRVDDAAALSAGFAFTTSITIPDPVRYNSAERYLVEECVTGEEISVDAAIRDGEVTPLFIGRKVVGYPPYAEEIGHFVDADDPLLTDPALVAALREAHAALGVENAWTHSEFMLTADGPKLIEVNGRLGGDLIPYLGLLATGIDPGLAAASVACGLAPDLTPSRQRVSGVRFFYVEEEDTTLGEVAFDGELPAAIDRSVVVAAPGAVVSPPPKGTVWGRIAFATVAADSVDACRRALDEAGAALVVNSV
ncbi:ATP-grasp domain-containing protein [Kitasatospora viridis]|uniref:Biotin carboxylase n=1 Tax=Kitasatospora viridis TaxID=281105 RepID=A0A561UC98_9ACTN|nr:ATP-grasp domain-containing protein [Kitasatospora viridis]TWF96988.1 biotin carboxylase [Kitasatospora viridis]